MPPAKFIHCPSCKAVVDAARAVCAGCGKCLACGAKRAEKLQRCAACDLPYCDCCGRCAKCLGLRYEGMDPCSCGHPNDADAIVALVHDHAIVATETPPADWKAVVFVLGLLVLIWVVVAKLLN